MTFDRALRRRLTGNPTVAGLVGVHPTDGRPSVEWGLLRQGSPHPGVTLALISDPRDETGDGVFSIRPSRVQADCLARDKTTAVALREAVIAALLPSGEFFGVWFDRARTDNGRSGAGDIEGVAVMFETIDFIIWHKG